ncbi:MAG TPA: roadblock/LC7 domain-containing protein [Thermoanaerobaculaceae bacterium]|nr:roadblock/LC7 domain-containing protein [Thermoanaerobaculaceae bacterium]HRS16382.1 roadblock/LC7 domain-containing protein [Thermoanaerobaculaceae bacterium]
MASLREVLSDLIKVEGVKTAVVVGRDGFVIDGVSRSTTLDTEALGAVISTGIGSSEVMGSELGVGEMTQGLLEFKGGLIVMGLVGRDAIVSLVADVGANLGNVRYQLKKRVPDLEKAL